MTELNDETIDKIARAVRNKKISKVWKDPKKAQIWGEGGWLVALSVGMISIMFFAIFDISEDFNIEIRQSDNEFRQVALSNMDCGGLKQTLLDLESDTKNESNWDVEKQILARCLP